MSGGGYQDKRQHPAFYALLTVLIFMSVGPIALMLVNSFKFDVDIISGTSGLLFLPTIQNYETALCDILPYELDHLDYCALKFGGAFINSLIIALISTLLTLIIGCLAAYALVRFRFMGRDTVSGTTLMVRMVPPAVLLVPVFGLWNNEFCIDKTTWLGELIRDIFGGRGDVCLAGTHSGIIIIYIAMNLPFVIWILQSFIVQVPRQLEEAAHMDGAGSFQVFFKIVLPLIKPGLAAAAIFTFRIAWNDYHGNWHVTGDPADHFHAVCFTADHHWHDCRCGQGLARFCTAKTGDYHRKQSIDAFLDRISHNRFVRARPFQVGQLAVEQTRRHVMITALLHAGIEGFPITVEQYEQQRFSYTFEDKTAITPFQCRTGSNDSAPFFNSFYNRLGK